MAVPSAVESLSVVVVAWAVEASAVSGALAVAGADGGRAVDVVQDLDQEESAMSQAAPLQAAVALMEQPGESVGADAAHRAILHVEFRVH